MPQMKVETRSYSEPRKCAVPESNLVTFVIKDESPESNTPFSTLFRSGQSSKSDANQIIWNGSTTEDNVTHSALSVLSNNCEEKTNSRDLGLHPSTMLNGHCWNGVCVNDAKKEDSDIKYSLFSDSLLNSVTSEPLRDNSMKIINDSVTTDFLDLISSISFPIKESKQISSDSYREDTEVLNKHALEFELLRTNTSSSDDCLKLNSAQNNSTLSDILSSITFDEKETFSDSKQFYNKNQRTPELSNLKFDNDSSKQNASETNNGTLSDILSSIALEENCPSTQNKSKFSSDSNVFLEDIKVPYSNGLNFDFSQNSHTSKAFELENNPSLSDVLSSISFHENNATVSEFKSKSLFSTDSSPHFEDTFPSNLKEMSSEYLNDKVLLSTDKPTNGETFSFLPVENTWNSDIGNALLEESLIDNKKGLTSITNIPKSSSNQKDGEFSFFSVSPDNVFSNILSNLDETADLQDKIVNKTTTDNETTPGLSMLDLLKSVNKDSNGSLSEYLSVPSDSKELVTEKKASETILDLNEILDIDLSTCIKANDPLNHSNCELPVNKNVMEANQKYPSEILLEHFMKPTFGDADSSGTKRPRMNINQSLFAKCLACKPKKNLVLLQKVDRIKSELYERYFNCQFPDDDELKMDKKPKIDKEMVVCKTNVCAVTFKGRRLCPEEVH